MQCPYFTIVNYGVYDSDMILNKKKIQSDRLISAYEFEFYTEDCPGGLTINGLFLGAKRGYFSCSKPGQHQRIAYPYKCYYFNISTQDEALCELLDNLPDFSHLWNMDEVIQAFHVMLTIESTTSLENRIRLEGYICQIIGIVAQSRKTTSEEDYNNISQHRKILQQADGYIRKHYMEDLSLSTLAAQCCLHPNYFHRIYTASFGITPAQRILSCRITAAKMMLLTQNRSISEISTECGFSSQTYFGYRFKESTGLTPRQYRKNMLGSRMPE